MGIIVWIVIGGVVGWIASVIMGTNGQQGIILGLIQRRTARRKVAGRVAGTHVGPLRAPVRSSSRSGGRRALGGASALSCQGMLGPR